ncbi:flavocytochrome c [Angelakisella massiliensis]|uniref:flavocytochrome c n=1 Tax=Angelakisella massiliensis TaxID=1871018 RepID=UPI0024B26D83|nr:flavocytochrome c [Angelakisella massiliensis]
MRNLWKNSRKALAVVLAIVMTMGLAACGGSQPAASPSSEESTASTGAQSATGTAKGFGGDVSVTVTVADGKITEVVAEGPGETEGVGSAALEQLPPKMVSGQTLDVDAISGATITSKAVVEAAKAAVTAMGLDPASFAGTGETAAAEDQEITADVVVVGAGGAGMTAAITAAKEGKQVVLVESMAMVGGNSVRATGGMNAAKTTAQDANEFTENAGVDKTLASAAEYASNETIAALTATVTQQWVDYQANPTGYFDSAELFQLDTLIGGKGVNDPALVAALVNNSADSIDWLKSIGINLPSVGSFGGASVKRIHRPVDAEGKTLSVGSYMIPILEKNCKELGIQLLLNTKADSILTDDTGAAVGITATGEGGAKVTVNAGSVVLATGGFGANLEMVTEYKPELAGFATTNAPGAQGDGIAMAQAIGAATVDMDQIQIHPTVEVETAALITEGLRGDGAILVNAEGKRFCDEVGTRDAVSAAEIAQTGSYGWLVIDQKMVDASSVIAGYITKGYTVQGDTYEALAEAMGVPAADFAATMEAWNGAVAAGKDEEFGRTSFAEALDTAPYYAIKVSPGVHHTMGGLKINTDTQVLNGEGAPIANLYAAGEITGGVHGANRLGGNAVADFVVFGRIAGAKAAENVG